MDNKSFKKSKQNKKRRKHNLFKETAKTLLAYKNIWLKSYNKFTEITNETNLYSPLVCHRFVPSTLMLPQNQAGQAELRKNHIVQQQHLESIPGVNFNFWVGWVSPRPHRLCHYHAKFNWKPFGYQSCYRQNWGRIFQSHHGKYHLSHKCCERIRFSECRQTRSESWVQNSGQLVND